MTVAYEECRAQRLVLAGGERSWTVLGGDHRPVGSAEEFLEYLRVQRVSPNTVKSYARALALWWQYLEAFGLSWDAVTLEDSGGFLAWLRTGDGPQVVSIERRPARFAESTIAARLQAVMSYLPLPPVQGVSLLAGMLDDRVRAREHQARVAVVEMHQVWRLPARSADFDDLADPL